MNKIFNFKKSLNIILFTSMFFFIIISTIYVNAETCKHQSSDDRRVIAPGWSYGTFHCSTYESGIKKVPWKAVTGKPYHYEFIAGENVNFPFYATIGCAIHYKTRAYLEGKEIFMPSPNELFRKKLKFTEQKPYYDFMIDPGTSLDNETQRGVKTYFRVRVTGKTFTNITRVKADKNKIIIRWKSYGENIRYQIAYKQKHQKTWKYKITNKNQLTIKNLKSKKYYNIGLRTVKNSHGQNIYGMWSNIKTVKVR